MCKIYAKLSEVLKGDKDMIEQTSKTKVNIEVPTDLLDKFKSAAKDRELTVSALIRLLMKEYLKSLD